MNPLGRRPLRREMQNVVVGCEDHQHHDDGEADAKAEFLGAFGQRLSSRRLDAIEQEMPAIEQWYGKKITQADGHRKHRGKA